jgi:hypothetical protein
VLTDILSEGLKLAIAGVLAGMGSAILLNRLIASLLFGVASTRRSNIRHRSFDDWADSRSRMFMAGLARIAAGPQRGAQIGVGKTTRLPSF